MQFSCSAIPSVNLPAQNADVTTKEAEKIAFLLKTFFGNFGKSIDGAKCECSLEHLSLRRERFFEIYFVRLIGTPNHNIPS